ncbi:MAG: hypothetical protein ACI9LU_003201 [Polaribacter sp.]|jgi:hypothetical protein
MNLETNYVIMRGDAVHTILDLRTPNEHPNSQLSYYNSIHV